MTFRRKRKQEEQRRKRIARAVSAGVLGAFLVSLIDRRRRQKLLGKAKGAAHSAAATATGGREYDDTTLARKVESEIFRPDDAPKDKVSVNVANGVVELRGQLDDQQQIDDLAKAAGKVAGVKDVHNLLHTP
jgi:osmotically-inducible protein OsmY